MDFIGAGQTAGMEALGAGMQSMLTTDLSQVATLTVVERARLKDLQGELKLGKSGAVDPATAARVGKLAGATHIATGSFTVIANKLRLDLRMVEVASGRVVLATSADGDLDAFFEVEKTLVNRLIGSLSITPSAKERGAIARIHTTNLEAFRQFSQGLRLFDQQKFDEALAALRSAAQKDEDFKLARLTLAEYERLAADLRSRAQGLETERALTEAETRMKALGASDRVMSRLFALAADKHDRERRAMALYLLYRAYDGRGLAGNLTDRFARARTADALAARYYTEAKPLYPAFPPMTTEIMNDPPRVPRSIETFDEDFARALHRLKTWDLPVDKGAPRVVAEYRKQLDSYRLAATTTHLEDFAQRLHLDRRGEADLRDHLYELALTLGPDAQWKETEIRERAEARRKILDVDASTALYATLSKSVRDPGNLRQLAQEIDKNAAIGRALVRGAPGAPLREYLMMSWEHGRYPSYDERAKEFFGAELSTREAVDLTAVRRLPGNGYTLLGELPMWPVGEDVFWSGARTDPRRTKELRYFSDHASYGVEPGGIVVLEGVPRRDLQARFDVDFTVPPDFWPRYPNRRDGTPRTFPSPGRPRVALLFAARDVDTPDENDMTSSGKVPQPMHGRALVLGPDRAQLVDLVVPRHARFGRREAPTIAPREEHGLTVDGGEPVAVTVRVSGTRLTVTVNGKAAQFTLPDAQEGFWGLWFQGIGYAAIRNVKLDAGGGRD
jgi:TolB-like protein